MKTLKQSVIYIIWKVNDDIRNCTQVCSMCVIVCCSSKAQKDLIGDRKMDQKIFEGEKDSKIFDQTELWLEFVENHFP